MQELATAIREAAGHVFQEPEPEEMDAGEFQVLDDAAQKWASYSLKTFRGELLTRALAISGALSSFVAQLKYGSEGQDQREAELARLRGEVERLTTPQAWLELGEINSCCETFPVSNRSAPVPAGEGARPRSSRGRLRAAPATIAVSFRG